MHGLSDNCWLISIGRPRSLAQHSQIEAERIFTRPRGPAFPERRYDKTSQPVTSPRHAQIKFSRDNTVRGQRVWLNLLHDVPLWPIMPWAC